MLSPDLKILVVDDSKTMRMIVKKMLRQNGLKNIHEAKNGKEGLEKLRNEKGFDAVLSDWSMPLLNGLDFLKAVRADEKINSIVFIMVSAESLVDNIKAAVKNGANGYITKPFTKEKIKKELECCF